jgi:RND family efflux transporter MFP subunit
MLRKIVKTLIPLLFILVGVVAAGWMINNPPKAEKQQVEERPTVVETMSVSPGKERIIVTAKGTVTPAKQIQLRPEVSGKVEAISGELVPGGLLRKGALLARIDARDYQFNVEAQKERVADAVYRLKLEQGQAEVARQEWQLLEDSIPTTEQGKELALREPQIEKAQASLEAAKSALEKAQLDLARTEITAPFNTIVLNESVDVGQVVNPQSPIATLAGTDQYWIRVSVPVADLGWIDIPEVNSSTGSPVRVTYHSGNRTIVREGKVERLLGDLEEAGRLSRLLVVVDDPLILRSDKRSEDTLPLLLGSYVTVEILGDEVENVFVIPRKTLRDVGERVAGEGIDVSWVWIMDEEGRLEVREVEIVWRLQNVVYVSNGLRAGDRLVTSGIPTPIEGMKLTLKQQTSTAQTAEE